MTRLTVRLFGPLAQRAGAEAVLVEVPSEAPTCAQVLAALPAELAGHRLAVNHEYASADTKISEADELALIGMVSGG